jgi:hypothetical protein
MITDFTKGMAPVALTDPNAFQEMALKAVGDHEKFTASISFVGETTDDWETTEGRVRHNMKHYYIMLHRPLAHMTSIAYVCVLMSVRDHRLEVLQYALFEDGVNAESDEADDERLSAFYYAPATLRRPLQLS